MDENDPLSEYNKIPLGHNLKSTSKLRSALPFISHTSFLALIRLNPNNHYNHGFHYTFDYNHFTNSD